MLRVEKLRKSFVEQVLFDDVDWFLADRDRVGLVGRNGTGKSTFLNILAGLEEIDAGTRTAPRNQSIGLLPQAGFEPGAGTVAQEARVAFAPILAWAAERDQIERRLADSSLPPSEAEQLAHRHEELGEQFRIHGGFEIDRQVQQVLTGLGFRPEEFDRPVRSLSGGWQMRVALARLLLGRPDVLLLDEPTNHLDIEARVWLESFLADYPGGFVVVSHDRHFLDRTVERITEIMSGKLVNYEGNYSRYVLQREARYEAARKAFARQQEEIARIERFIERFRSKNTKATQVQSRVKMLEKMTRLRPPPPLPRSIQFRFPQPERSGRIVLRLRGVEKSYGTVSVFRGVDLDIERGERVALVGPNGAGKSTLMRILAGRELLQAGERTLGMRVTTEFFAQDEANRLPPHPTLLEETMRRAPVSLIPRVRGLLGAFLFRGDDVEKQIGVLSGGERNRFAVMLMLLRPANLLLLDEPTNHLDIEAQEVLLAALRGFEGSVVFVSHDHHFLSRLATRVIEVGGGSIHSHPGDYASYLWKKEQQEAGPAVASVLATRAPEPSAEPVRSRRKGEQRRSRRLGELEGQIETLEQRKARIEGLMASDGFYRDAEKSRFYLDEHRDLLEELNGLYEEWHALEEEDR